MQHPWDNSTIFYQQVKESGIIPTFDGFCFPQKEKRETRFAMPAAQRKRNGQKADPYKSELKSIYESRTAI